MKKLSCLLFLAIGVTACSVKSLDSTENLLTTDANMKIQQVEKSMHLKSSEICAGEAPIFVFNFPQDTKGNGNPKETNVKIQMETYPGSGEWESFKDVSYDGAGPEEYTYEDAILEVGTYSFRVKIGSGGYDYFATLTVKDCCTESFNYEDNGDGTYTFTYTAGEDINGAKLVFTFAQGVTISGLDEWESNGQTMQSEMDLFACTTYSWTVGLDVVCNGVGQPNANLWTDFNVNDSSKKSDLSNIVKNC